MPFKKDDPATIEAAKIGGKTGVKHFETLNSDQLRKMSSKAGKLGGAVRRQKSLERKTSEKVDNIMSDYKE